jgi:hypothetical protein
MDKNIIIIYLLLMFIVVSYKPHFLFNENGELKRFGVSRSKNETPFDLLIFTVFICFLITFIFTLIKI